MGVYLCSCTHIIMWVVLNISNTYLQIFMVWL